MGLNWVEDIVAHLYRSNGYMVVQNEDLLMPKTATRSIRGHSDIDVIAIKGTSIVHIECQSWWGPAKNKEQSEFHRLLERFQNAPHTIFHKYAFLKKKDFDLSRIFVTSGKPLKSTGKGPWDRLERFCAHNQIELLEIDTVIKRLSTALRRLYPTGNIVGKEPPLSRLLLHLIHGDFLKEEVYEE